MRTKNPLFNPSTGIKTIFNLKIWHEGRFIIKKKTRLYDDGCLDIIVGCSEINYFGIVQSVRKVIERKNAQFTVYYRCKGRSLMNGLIEFTPNTPLVDVLATKDENNFITVFVEYYQSIFVVGSYVAGGGGEEDNDHDGFKEDNDDDGCQDNFEYEDAGKNMDWAGPKVLEGCQSTFVGPEVELDHNRNPQSKKGEKLAALSRKTKAFVQQLSIEQPEPQIEPEDDRGR